MVQADPWAEAPWLLLLHQALQGAVQWPPASHSLGICRVLGNQVPWGSAWSRWTTKISFLQQGYKAEQGRSRARLEEEYNEHKQTKDTAQKALSHTENADTGCLPVPPATLSVMVLPGLGTSSTCQKFLVGLSKCPAGALWLQESPEWEGSVSAPYPHLFWLGLVEGGGQSMTSREKTLIAIAKATPSLSKALWSVPVYSAYFLQMIPETAHLEQISPSLCTFSGRSWPLANRCVYIKIKSSITETKKCITIWRNCSESGLEYNQTLFLFSLRLHKPLLIWNKWQAASQSMCINVYILRGFLMIYPSWCHIWSQFSPVSWPPEKVNM